jgi:hypothetical protein
MKLPSIDELRSTADELGFRVDEEELTSFQRAIELDILPAFHELSAWQASYFGKKEKTGQQRRSAAQTRDTLSP